MKNSITGKNSSLRKASLIGTSAMVAAVSFVGVAQAAEPIKLSIGGFGGVFVGYASQDDDFITATQKEVTSVDVKGDNEIHFKGSTTLDNGLTVSAKYELEAGGASLHGDDADPADEYNITVSGSFGSIVAGADDNVVDYLAVGAPTVATSLFGLGGDDVIDGKYVLLPSDNTALDDTTIGLGGDAESITYMTPAVMGFTFGATYMPDATSGDDNPEWPTSTIRDNGDVDLGSNEAYFAVLAWSGEVSDVAIDVEGGYAWSDIDTSTIDPGLGGHEEWQAGATFGYAGFAFGGAYHWTRQETGYEENPLFRNEVIGNAWQMGASYETGPYGVSLAYIETSKESLSAGVSDDTRKVWELAGEYAMGPGIKLLGGVAYADFENGTASDATPEETDGSENSGWVVATGLALSF